MFTCIFTCMFTCMLGWIGRGEGGVAGVWGCWMARWLAGGAPGFRHGAWGVSVIVETGRMQISSLEMGILVCVCLQVGLDRGEEGMGCVGVRRGAFGGRRSAAECAAQQWRPGQRLRPRFGLA